MACDLHRINLNLYHKNQTLYHKRFHKGFPLLSIFSAWCSTYLFYHGICITACNLYHTDFNLYHENQILFHKSVTSATKIRLSITKVSIQVSRY